MEAPGLVSQLADHLGRSGIDIVTPLQLHWCVRCVGITWHPCTTPAVLHGGCRDHCDVHSWAAGQGHVHACLALTSVPPLLRRYNKAIPNDLGARIAPPTGSAGSRALCILIGNSKLAWEPFLKACSTQGLLTLEHPFNSYVEAAVESSLKECAAR